MSHRKDAGTPGTDREYLNRTTSLIIEKAIVVHSKLGPGLLESVYSTCLWAAVEFQGSVFEARHTTKSEQLL